MRWCGDDVFDLSDKKWTFGAGKQIVERHLAMKLFGCLPSVIEHMSNGDQDQNLRWNSERRLSKFKINTPPSDQEQELFTSTKSAFEEWSALLTRYNGNIPSDEYRKLRG